VEEDFLRLESCIKGRVALELPKGFGGIDPYMEVDGCHVFFACSVIGSGDPIHICVEVFTNWDISVLRERIGIGCFVNGKDGVVGIDLQEVLKEFMEKGLDGIQQGVRRGPESVNAEEDIIKCRAAFGHGKEGGGWVECRRRRGRRSSGTGVGAVIMSDVRGVDRRADVQGNWYIGYVGNNGY
jgi:hypothetical protein